MITNYEGFEKLKSKEKLSCLKDIKDVKLLNTIKSNVKRKVLIARITAILTKLDKIESQPIAVIKVKSNGKLTLVKKSPTAKTAPKKIG
jgi:hypothetical protein